MLHYPKRKKINSNFTLLLSWHFRLPPFRARFGVMTRLATIVTLLLIRLCSWKFRTNSSKMVSSALETLHCPSSFTLRSGVRFLLSFLIDATVVRMCPHDPTWALLQLFHHLCLFHQYMELSDQCSKVVH